ncbi:NADH-quinone oxidoreductase subunit NuoN [Nocardioides jishulii]|uniref:NADH-quinone oxidoreductase subunit N n=1 Tax=Nocardioides jishulii TaxID=2575440 RepID=A0A4U2YSL0_9ACTN|nr:NADH-quinone oxidoreductase subunit NuoN [Nocardioides jishulii]QCX28659.1 NADH-quinone oxidoreductase subunit NuoN [Nocardioides jishulii]TKI64448.1 NADH-quinone oxidoreductase subunit NuoN [Nocardioides jishulii]
MNEFVKPSIEYFELAPLLVVFGAACIAVLVEAFMPRAHRFVTQVALTFVALAVALALVVVVALDYADVGPVAFTDGRGFGVVAAMGSVAVDGPTLFLWGVILVLALLGTALFAERRLDGGLSAFAGQAASAPGSDAENDAARERWEHTEVYPLLLFAVTGMLLFPAANDLLVLFVALEVLSLPLYLLAGLARRRRLLSQEAALKYFLLGAFSSAFFLYGAALLYGYAGSMQFGEISDAIANRTDAKGLLLVAIGLLAVGLFFKIGAAPFHAWSPDVYQGSPTPLTAFMAAATKVAAFGAILRLFYVALGNDRTSWLPVFWIVAILSMVVGTVLAIGQSDVKRLLAYSSVAHAGFVLTGVLGVQSASSLAPDELSSAEAVLFYLTTYGLTTLGAFAVVSLVRDAGGETTQLSRWAGLGKDSPLIAGIFAFFLLAMAGIPLTSGFTGKWAVFSVALAAGAWPVVLVAVLMSAAAAWIYLKVIVLMYFREPEADSASVAAPSILTSVAIAVTAVATLVLGIVPDPLLDVLAGAGEFLR